MIQDIKDRLPTKPNTWEVTHSDSTVEEVTVARADEPTEVGTPINSALFKNLQGDVYTGIQYNTPTYSGNDMTLDLPLTSYETGKIVNIISPATFSTNPTLNINGLGAKTVNSLLTLNQKCTLIYNGSSFDVTTDVATNKYYPITKTTSTTNITGVNIIPQTGWTETGTNEYTAKNGIKIWATSASSAPIYAVDGNIATSWQATSTSNQYFYIEFPQPIKINKMKTFITSVSSSGAFSFAISGSNDINTWSGIALASSSTRQTALTELTFNSSYTGEYKYYRIYVYSGSSSNYPKIVELEVSDYDTYLFTADYPVTSVNDKFQINVVPNADSLSVGKNYLLLSGLGTAKEIEGSFGANELCTFAYDGTKLIKTKAEYSDIEQGTDDFKYVTPYLARILANSIVTNGTLSSTGSSYVEVDFGTDVKAIIIQLADYGTMPYVLLKGQTTSITIETNATINSFSSTGVLKYMSRTKSINYIALY